MPTRGATRATIAGPGATPKPAWRIDQSHTPVRNRIEPKNSAENAVPKTSMARFPQAKFRMPEQVEVQGRRVGAALLGDEGDDQRHPAANTADVRALSQPKSSEPTTP